MVRRLTRQEFIDAYQVREVLESVAIKLVVPLLTQEERNELRAMCERMEQIAERGDTDAFFEVNREFHERLVHASGNRMRKDVHGQLVAQMGHLMKKSLDLRGGTRESAAEHRGYRAVAHAIS